VSIKRLLCCVVLQNAIITECYYAEDRFSECCYADSHYAECCGNIYDFYIFYYHSLLINCVRLSLIVKKHLRKCKLIEYLNLSNNFSNILCFNSILNVTKQTGAHMAETRFTLDPKMLPTATAAKVHWTVALLALVS
jgi:hypothetical protein